MPALVAWIGTMLLSVAGQIVFRILLTLGIGLATNQAAASLGLGERIQTVLGQAGPLYDYVGFFGLDVAITIVLSAWAGRMLTDAAKVYFVRKGAA